MGVELSLTLLPADRTLLLLLSCLVHSVLIAGLCLVLLNLVMLGLVSILEKFALFLRETEE